MKLRKTISHFADITVIGLLVYLLVFPQRAAVPTREALVFCAKTLIPSLFIYMVLAKMVITLPLTEKLTRIIGLEAFLLITGTLCGCPVGAKNAVLLYESGKISKKHAEYLCSFTNNASVSFVVGYVGGELFGDVGIGIRLLVYQIAASTLTAVVMKYLTFGKNKLPKADCECNYKIGLREAVSDSAESIINICACAVFFIVAGGAVSEILTLEPLGSAVFKSVLEFSSGAAAAAELERFAIPVTAFAIGQTGLSVALQVRSVTAKKLAFRPFIAGKILSCAIMTMLAVIFG